MKSKEHWSKIMKKIVKTHQKLVEKSIKMGKKMQKVNRKSWKFVGQPLKIDVKYDKNDW